MPTPCGMSDPCPWGPRPIPSWNRSDDADDADEGRPAEAAVLEEKDRWRGSTRLIGSDCPVMVKLVSSSSSSLPTTMGSAAGLGPLDPVEDEVTFDEMPREDEPA